MMSWVHVYQVGIFLTDFIRNFGEPYNITFYGARVQAVRNTTFVTELRRYEVKWHVSQPYGLNKNPSEAAISRIKKKVYL